MSDFGADDDIIAVDGPSQLYADNDVNGMIRAVAAENPAGVIDIHSFEGIPDLFYSSAVLSSGGYRNLSNENKNSTKGKKKKVESDDDEPPPSITYYIFIPKTPAITFKKRSGSSKSADDDSIQRGPFTLPMSKPYSSLLSAIATALPCLPENINESKITWKPKKPQNAAKLALGKTDRYKAMLMEMEDKGGSRTVLLYMPPPTPMEDATPWDTANDPAPQFDFTGLEPTLASDSILAQKASFNQATKEHRAKLEETYPVGQHPQFPGRRVYFDAATGFYFELNSTRLGVWSSAMAQGKTDEKRLLSSNFFDANQRIKSVTAVAVPAVPAAPVIPAFAPAVSATPAIPAVAGTSLSLTDLLLASILTRGGGGGGLAGLLPQLNPAVLPPVAAAPPPPQPRCLPSNDTRFLWSSSVNCITSTKPMQLF
ncbi:hypothetical protein B0H13DRAFT_2448071 [Mycena leptocephala]|nr:hypothetical protein B0H13DRAFT_2448071 [Mycena leptocephala]